MENIMPMESVVAATAGMKQRMEARFSDWWDALMKGVNTEGDGFGLFGPSSYVLRVGEAKILIDPCFRFPSLGEKIAERLPADLAAFDAVVLTHSHGDHLCKHFWKCAEGAPVKNLYVPAFFEDELLRKNNIDPNRVSRIEPGSKIPVKNATVLAFLSNHKRETQTVGLPELGYSFRAAGKTYLMPCDVRTYTPGFFGKLVGSAPDAMFSHIWFSAKHGLAAPWEPKLTEFCNFINAFRPKRVVLAHLYETGRTPDEMWSYLHAGAVADRLLAISPETDVTVPQLGQWYPL